MEKILEKTTKLFLNGRSQAVRLPASFRFDCEEVKIRRNPVSGDVIISALHKNWDSFLLAAKDMVVPEDFMSNRGDDMPQEREVL